MNRILVSTAVALVLSYGTALAHGDKAKADSTKEEKPQKKDEHKDRKGHGHDAKKH